MLRKFRDDLQRMTYLTMRISSQGEGYFMISYGYFMISYGYFMMSYGYFMITYGYFMMSYGYFISKRRE